MIKKISILSLFALLLVFTGCEKCSKPMQMEDPFYNSNDRGAVQDRIDNTSGNRGSEDNTLEGGNGPTGGGITDPNEDEDFDGIVDPDEDEDFDKDGK